MKRHFLNIAIAAAAVLLAGQSAEAQIQAGDIIAIDLGQTGRTTGGNWNDVDRIFQDPNDRSFDTPSENLITNLTTFGDGSSTNAGFSWERIQPMANSVTGGIGGADLAAVNASFDGIGAIPLSAQRDLSAFAGPSRLVFSDLDPNFTYDLQLMSWIGTLARNSQNIIVNGTTIRIDPNSTQYVYDFNNIELNGNDAIQISFASSGGNAGQQHVNALALTAVAPAAVPEPSSAFVLLGLGGLSVLRRRRR